jgi:hypothetical protein
MGLLSNYFELFVYVDGCVLVLFLIGYAALKLRDVDFKKFLCAAFRGTLYGIIVIGQIIFLISFGYLYWKNYHRPAPELQLSHNVLAVTQWVKSDLTVYFIDGHLLKSIKVNGRDAEDVFRADDPVKEYHFSPDGRYLLIATQYDLALLRRDTKEQWRIDTVKPSSVGREVEKEGVKGAISGIQWSPDSRKFLYEVSRWSRFATQDNVYIYTVEGREKKSIQSPARRVSSLYWDKQGETIYYLRHEARDTTVYSAAFEVNVFRIPLTTLVPEDVVQISYDKSSVPLENLMIRGIDLFLDAPRFSFGRSAKENHLVSEKGPSVSIDEQDNLYFINSRWFRKRLFKIPREQNIGDMPRYQYKGGGLVIDHIRWIPGGRYVIMEHKYWGVIILEPSSRKIGLLVKAHGHSFGWYQPVSGQK